MKDNQVKSFRFMGGVPTDIYNGIVDVFVTLEGDDFEYWVEIATAQALSSHMEKNKENFIEPGYPCIIVRDIREALKAFAVDKVWLKLYHLTVDWNINDLNTILDRQKKRLKDEEEEEED